MLQKSIARCNLDRASCPQTGCFCTWYVKGDWMANNGDVQCDTEWRMRCCLLNYAQQMCKELLNGRLGMQIKINRYRMCAKGGH